MLNVYICQNSTFYNITIEKGKSVPKHVFVYYVNKSTKMYIITVAFLLLFNYLNSLPKLYYFCCNKRDLYVSDLRKFEKLSSKISKLQLDIRYFEQCVNLKLCPKFLMFKPPKLKAYNKLDKLKAEVLKNQISLLRKELQITCKQYIKLKSKIREKLSFLEYSVLISRITKKCQLDVEIIKQRHQQKLTNLWKSQRVSAPDCLINRSNKRLSIEEENALRLGLKHHILPKNIDEIQIKTQVEQLWHFSKKTIVTGYDSLTEIKVKD